MASRCAAIRLSHPRHQEIGGGAMLGRKEYPRQMFAVSEIARAD
jgi:hypothetical protein